MYGKNPVYRKTLVLYVYRHGAAKTYTTDAPQAAICANPVDACSDRCFVAGLANGPARLELA
jgi:hypothetical protein